MQQQDDPYTEERRRWDLAWRLLRHGARTQAIARWTGLSKRRIRGLAQRFGSQLSARDLRRPRGKSPSNLDALLRSRRRRWEATLFAHCCQQKGLLSAAVLRQPQRGPDIGRGERLCDTYEGFKQDYPSVALSIEEAMLLEAALTANQEYGLELCPRCRSPILRDRLAVSAPRCESCSRSWWIQPSAAPSGDLNSPE